MINPPDDLLADLQSALPPEQQVPTPTPPSSAGRQANGHAHLDDHLYDHAEGFQEPERYDRMAVAPERASSTVSWERGKEGGREST